MKKFLLEKKHLKSKIFLKLRSSAISSGKSLFAIALFDLPDDMAEEPLLYHKFK